MKKYQEIEEEMKCLFPETSWTICKLICISLIFRFTINTKHHTVLKSASYNKPVKISASATFHAGTLAPSETSAGIFFLSGIPDRHHLRSDVDRQPPQIQQHDEETDSEQQYGGTDLAAGHHLQEFQDCRLPLDHHAQPAAPDMERREDTLHLKVTGQTLGFRFSLRHVVSKVNNIEKWAQWASIYRRVFTEVTNVLKLVYV